MKITEEQVEKLINNSTYDEHVFHNKCLVVTCKLPSGFVITGVGACVDPLEFNIEKGRTIAMRQIENKIWELEGYVLQKEISSVPF